MTKTSTLIASAAVIALTLGVTSRADVPTEKESILPPGVIIVAADEAQPENSPAPPRWAKNPARNRPTTPQLDQPARRNPTGATASDQNAAH